MRYVCLLPLLALSCRTPELLFSSDLASSDLAGADLSGADLAVGAGDLAGRDLAGVCPRPPAGTTFRADTLSCAQLGTAYASAVDGAKECGCAADCSIAVCDGLCCTCQVFVSPGNEAAARAKLILDEWNQRVAGNKCTPPPCPALACAAPVLDGCKSNVCTTTH